MIEIGHPQARRMLQESLDRNISDNQWSALQEHLEVCAECRAYRAQLQALERSLRRELRGHWEGITAPGRLRAEEVQVRRVKKTRTRRLAWAGTGAALAVLFFWLAGGMAWVTAQTAALRVKPPAAEMEGAPLQEAPYTGAFTTQVLISAWVGGRSDLYLLTPGKSPQNLTGAPGAPEENTDPAWSLDGEWIAYLASHNGKREVMVTEPTGGAQYQLTNEPGIDWAGPLSWSPDGKWIALTGIRREQGAQSWIYLVPVDGREGPRALGETRGGWAAEFSPTGAQVAFLSGNGESGSVAVFTFDGSAEFKTVKPEMHWAGPAAQGVRVSPGVIHFANDRVESAAADVDSAAQALPTVEAFSSGAGLDWSPDGNELVFLGETVQGSGIALTIQRAMDYSASLYGDFQVITYPARSLSSQAFRAVTFSPSGSLVYLENPDATLPVLTPGTGEICWRLKSGPISPVDEHTLQFNLGKLCFDSVLDRSSWSQDGQWLVVAAHYNGEKRSDVYAVRAGVLRPSVSPSTGDIVRISDGVEIAGPGTLPRVRPAGASLGIRPQPVSPSRAELAPSDIRAAPGEVVFAVQNNSVTVIVSSSPDGTRGRVLTASSGYNSCPRISPDGSQVAFLSDWPHWLASAAEEGSLGLGGAEDMRGASGMEIYRMPLSGGKPERISDASLFPTSEGSAVRYMDCPYWSPDGSYLAAPLSTLKGDYLAIYPQPELRVNGMRGHLLSLQTPVQGMAWTADSRRLVVVQGENPITWLLDISLPELPGAGLTVEEIAPPYTLGKINGLAVTPGGEQVFLLSTETRGAVASLALLRQFTIDGWVEGVNLPVGPTVRPVAASDSLAWRGDNRLGFILHGQLADQHKSTLLGFNTTRGGLDVLAEFEDVITNAAWSPDGNWVIFSAESGLWGLDTRLAAAGKAAPVWISPQPVNNLDWN